MKDDSMKRYALTIRGEPSAIAAFTDRVVIATKHHEGRGQGVYVLNPVEPETRPVAHELESGALSLALEGDALWVGCEDGAVRTGSATSRKGGLQTLGAPLGAPVTGLCALGERGVAAACGRAVVLLGPGGAELSRVEFDARVTAIARDVSGAWLAAGTERGLVRVLEVGASGLTVSGEQQAHAGACNALLFDASGELRLYAAGADSTLKATHARGELAFSERGGAKAIGPGPIVALAMGPSIEGAERRFYSAAAGRGGLKAWLAGRSKRAPASAEIGTLRPIGAALFELGGRPHLAVLTDRGAIECVAIEEDGKLGGVAVSVRGIMDWAEAEFERTDPSARSAALERLAAIGDGPAVRAIAERARADADVEVRAHAARALAGSDLAEVPALLRRLVRDEGTGTKPRLAALESLRAVEGENEVGPLLLALQTNDADLGRAAIEGLRPLASSKSAQALEALEGALKHAEEEVALEALAALESIRAERPALAYLAALNDSGVSASVAKIALVRAWEAGAFADADLETARRRILSSQEGDGQLARAAFWVGVLMRPVLARALRGISADVHKELFALENFGRPKKAGSKEPELPKAELPKQAPPVAERLPLIEGVASRRTDIAALAAWLLGTLRDERALGALLELSRDPQPKTRSGACYGMLALGDMRAIGRLTRLLDDPSGQVREAAYFSIEWIETARDEAAKKKEERRGWARVVRTGLRSGHADVRARALGTLAQAMRADAKKRADAEAVALVAIALDDQEASVRTEAAKNALALEIGGSTRAALGALFGSVHPDVRRTALQETLVHLAEPWGWELLAVALDDPDAGVRAMVFSQGADRARRARRDLFWIESAISSRFADVRALALEALADALKLSVKTASSVDGAMPLLAAALEDEDEANRVRATGALAGALAAPDEALRAAASRALAGALDSSYAEVRAAAALALAGLADARALGVLEEIIAEPEPDEDAATARAAWRKRVAVALSGVSVLGEARNRKRIAALIDHEDRSLGRAAARAFARSAPDEGADALLALLRHEDDAVRLEVALGLARMGRPEGAHVALDAKGRDHLLDRCIAALALLDRRPDRFYAYLDASSGALAEFGLALLMLRDVGEDADDPAHALALLGAEAAPVRLSAARFVERGADRAARLELCRAHLACAHASSWPLYASEASRCAHLDHHDLGLDEDRVRTLAAALASDSSARERVRAAELVARLVIAEPAGQWERARGEAQSELERYTDEIAPTKAKRKGLLARAKDALRVAVSGDDLVLIAAGAYVALSRQKLDYVRHASLRRLAALANERGELVPEARASLLAALDDDATRVRTWAFWVLSGGRGLGDAEESGAPPKALAMDGYALVREAIATGRRDVGERALAMIAELGGSDQGKEALESIVRERDEELAESAVALLAEMIGEAAAYRVALDGARATVRARSFRMLLELSDAGDAEALRTIEEAARDAQDTALRRGASVALAERGLSAGYDCLSAMARGDDGAAQIGTGVEALVRLARASDERARVLETLLAIAGRAPGDSIGGADAAAAALAALGSLRDESAIDGLAAIAERDASPAVIDAVLRALFLISGSDQPLHPFARKPDEDPLTVERPPSFVVEHAHHPEALARALSLAHALHRPSEIAPLARAAMLVPAQDEASASIDALLESLALHTDEDARVAAIEALGWRARHRGASTEGLARALQAARSPAESLAAASALALSGESQGLSVLLALTEFVEDAARSERAVEALGALLGAPDALDEAATRRVSERLLAMAADLEHPLRAASMAAVGRAGRGPRGPEIVALLRASVQRDAPYQSKYALEGLRWVGTREAWDQVREVAAKRPTGDWLRMIALELLGDDDTDASRAVLRDALQTTYSPEDARAALDSLRRLEGRESLEPDYAAVLATASLGNVLEVVLERLTQRGDAARLIRVIAEVRDPSIGAALTGSLYARDPLPVDGALEALSSPLDAQIELAARILGRAPRDASIGTALAASLEEAERAWGAAWAEAERGCGRPAELEARGARLAALVWACGRHGAGAEAVIRLAALPHVPAAAAALVEVPCALEAIADYAKKEERESCLEALASLALGGPVGAREAAGAALGRLDSVRAAALAPLADVAVSYRITRGDPSPEAIGAARDAARSAANQASALGVLIDAGEVDALATIARDEALTLEARLGALDAIAAISSEGGEDRLAQIGRDVAIDEDVRRGAWRGRRRSTRRRKKVNQEVSR